MLTFQKQETFFGKSLRDDACCFTVRCRARDQGTMSGMQFQLPLTQLASSSVIQQKRY